MKSISFRVKQKIGTIPKGEIFTLENFGEIANKRAVVLVLNRLKKEGEIERLAKGKYYVPRKTKFGLLGPSESSIMNALLKEDDGSYISGLAAYNRLGLTTQLPREITIVGNRYDRKVRIENIMVKFVKRRTPVSGKKNNYILQILDAINDVKKIPDTSTNEAISILKDKILNLSSSDKKQVILMSRYYRPFVRAIVGGILEEVGTNGIKQLRSSINPVTVFNVNISEKTLPLKKSWNLR